MTTTPGSVPAEASRWHRGRAFVRDEAGAVPVLGSVVIPAHNEAKVIGRCLSGLLEGMAPGELEVIVVCNGCTDGSEDVARQFLEHTAVLEARGTIEVSCSTRW